MASQINGPAGVSVITPAARDTLTKTVQVVRTDTTRFDAFGLPKNAVIVGAYVMGATASNAASSATITVGTSTSGTEILNVFDVKGAGGQGYHPAGASAGASVGTQLTADTVYKAVYAESGTASDTGGPWLVKVEYYIPPSGLSY